MKVSVVIPTVAGRAEYLARCMRGYSERTAADLQFIIVRDEPSCGIAWQQGAARAHGDFLHLTADDIVPGEGWLPPMVEATERGSVPCALIVVPNSESLDAELMPRSGNPMGARSQFFERTPSGPGEVPDWYVTSGESEYPSVPFCTMEQWRRIEPMVASHYGTDKWFGLRAQRAGMTCVARHGACFYHYAALPGRVPAQQGWLHTDRLDFDLNVAFPLYRDGHLDPLAQHPEWNTHAGRELARAWRRANTPAPWPWDLEPDPQYQ